MVLAHLDKNRTFDDQGYETATRTVECITLSQGSMRFWDFQEFCTFFLKTNGFSSKVYEVTIVRSGWWLLGAALRAGDTSFLIHPVVSFFSFYVNRHGAVIVCCSPWYYRPCSVSQSN